MRATDILMRPFRKLRLTVKDVNKGYYKGTRTGRMGTHTKRGGYMIEYAKVRTYVVPSLEGFKVGFICCSTFRFLSASFASFASFAFFASFASC